MDLHSGQCVGYFDIPVDHVYGDSGAPARRLPSGGPWQLRGGWALPLPLAPPLPLLLPRVRRLGRGAVAGGSPALLGRRAAWLVGDGRSSAALRQARQRWLRSGCSGWALWRRRWRPPCGPASPY